MAIYRGDGGAGDATDDVTVNQIADYVNETLGYKNAAATSATNASTSESNAATSATNAASSATSAGSSATAAASSATAASTSASNASTSETNAADSATAAAASAASAASYGEASAVDYTASGAGAVTRTVNQRLNDVVSVKDFGAVGDGVTDDTAAIQAAIDHITSIGGGVIKYPVGDYRTTGFALTNKTVHEGVGPNSIIRPLTSASDFITLDTGPVTQAGFRSISILGGTIASPFTAINTGQCALSFTAVADASTTGGWWYQIMEDVTVSGFDSCIELIAGDNNLLPHQFGVWRNAQFIRNDAGGITAKFSNQINQIICHGCKFDARGSTTTGINIQFNTGTLTAFRANSFYRCAIQNSNQGIVSDGSENVRFEDCWFENLKQAVTLSGSNKRFIFGGRFANAANDSGSGYLLKATGSGSVKMEDSVITGTTDKIVDSLGSGIYFDSELISNAESATAFTSGVTKQVSESSGVLTCGEGSIFLVNTSATNITTINSDQLAGKSIYLKALGGTIKLATGGNISLGSSSSPLTIPQNQVVHLVRYDLGGTWQLADSGVQPDDIANMLETTDIGSTVQGYDADTAKLDTDQTWSATQTFGDNVKAQFGDDNDLQIYHDGSNSFITNSGTGNLRLQGTNLVLQNAAATQNYLICSGGGATTLYYNNSEKLTTTSTGIDVTGNIVVDDASATVDLTSDAGGVGILNFNSGVGAVKYNVSGDRIGLFTNSTEAVRLDTNGNVTVGPNLGNTIPAVGNVVGIGLSNSGQIQASRDSSVTVQINRKTNDGVLVYFRQDGTIEGNISVSGTTVSYNGGHLARWSQLADNTRDASLVKGTVLTNLDQMAVWGDEDNEQLNCMAVSTVEGDPNVAGVFVNWDDDDEDYTNDMNIAMTGDMVIRIARGTTVQRGDLLMSAGDGTAKPQGDDIVRSKTIAKVTSTHVSHTYNDGSYLVPCVLMAC